MSRRDTHVPTTRSALGGLSGEKPRPSGNPWLAGVQTISTKPIRFSALIFTPGDLDVATHTFDIIPRDETIFPLDHLMAALGSSACDPRPLDRYLIRMQETSFVLPRTDRVDHRAYRRSRCVDERFRHVVAWNSLVETGHRLLAQRIRVTFRAFPLGRSIKTKRDPGGKINAWADLPGSS